MYFMKKVLFNLMICSSMTCPILGQAQTTQPWYVGIGAGATFLAADSSSVFTSPGWPDDKYTIDNVDTSALFSVFGGYQWERDCQWLPFLSVQARYYYSTESNVKGKVRQFSLPELENYHYDYSLRTQSVLGLLKANMYRYNRVAPFVLGGVGVAWNKTSDYHEKAYPNVTPRPSPDFKGETTHHFAYLFGTGLDFILTQNIWLSATYHFEYLGHARTGSSRYEKDSTISSRFYTNNILFSIQTFF